MRVLLTGASGQVGGAIKSRLTEFDLLAPGRVSFDLEQDATILSCIETFRPQIVINCAAYTAVDDAERDRDRAMRVNGIAPGIIAAGARKAGAALLHLSTDYVFDGAASAPYSELSRCAPLNVYGESKLRGEQAITKTGVASLIIRTSWVYGPKGQNFLHTMLRLGAARPEIQVVNDQTGSPTSALVLADNIASILYKMAGDATAYLRRHGGILNMTCGGETTWYGFATEIFREARQRGMSLAVNDVRPISTALFERPAKRPAYSVLDLSRLQEEFAIAPVPWQQSLQTVMDQLTCSNSTRGN